MHFCIFPYLLNICRKFEFLISQGSAVTCVRWGGYCGVGFIAIFTSFPVLQNFSKSVKIWQSYREFKGGNFFETQCSVTHSEQNLPSYTIYHHSSSSLLFITSQSVVNKHCSLFICHCMLLCKNISVSLLVWIQMTFLHTYNMPSPFPCHYSHFHYRSHQWSKSYSNSHGISMRIPFRWQFQSSRTPLKCIKRMQQFYPTIYMQRLDNTLYIITTSPLHRLSRDDHPPLQSDGFVRRFTAALLLQQQSWQQNHIVGHD